MRHEINKTARNNLGEPVNKWTTAVLHGLHGVFLKSYMYKMRLYIFRQIDYKSFKKLNLKCCYILKETDRQACI